MVTVLHGGSGQRRRYRVHASRGPDKRAISAAVAVVDARMSSVAPSAKWAR
jgi:hypothetical protein